MAHRDSQTGEYNETYPLEGFIHALDRLGEEVGTRDVEQAVGCQYRTAIAKLHELEDEGAVSSRRVGNAYLWSLADTCNMDEQNVDRESSTGELPPEEDGGQSGSSNIYDPTEDLE